MSNKRVSTSSAEFKASNSKKKSKNIPVDEEDDEGCPDLLDFDDFDRKDFQEAMYNKNPLSSQSSQSGSGPSVSAGSAFSTPVKGPKPKMVTPNGPLPGSKEFVLQRNALKGIKQKCSLTFKK